MFKVKTGVEGRVSEGSLTSVRDDSSVISSVARNLSETPDTRTPTLSRADFILHLNSLIHPSSPWHGKKQACWDFVRYCFARWDVELDPDTERARPDFEEFWRAERDPCPPPARFMDVAVFRDSSMLPRHCGVMIDGETFFHCADSTNGVSRSEITRPAYHHVLCYMVRYRHHVFTN
jgi:hypothetical protein